VTYKQLATESGLQLPTLYAWIQRLQREKSAPSSPSAMPGQRSSFVELKTTGGGRDSALGGGVEIVLASGLRVRVEAGFHEATLTRVLATLGA
jgi:transposase-like protein